MNAPRRNSSVVAADAGQMRRMSIANPDLANLSEDAAKATRAEQNMTLLQGLELYPKAVAWSILLSAAIIMEGFDIVLIANLLALPAFKRAFAKEAVDREYVLFFEHDPSMAAGYLREKDGKRFVERLI